MCELLLMSIVGQVQAKIVNRILKEDKLRQTEAEAEKKIKKEEEDKEVMLQA